MSDTEIHVHIDANDPGSVFDVAKNIKKYLVSGVKVTPYKDSFKVVVEGTDSQDVERAMTKYRGAFAKGHGGYLFNYKVTEMKIDKEEVLRKQIRKECQQELDSLKENQRKLEKKWSEERKSYDNRIEIILDEVDKCSKEIVSRDSIINDRDRGYQERENILRESVLKRDETISQTQTELDKAKNELNTPLYKFVFNRLKKFVNR